MRLHLPPSLRSALLASLVSFSGIYSYSHAATSADFWPVSYTHLCRLHQQRSHAHGDGGNGVNVGGHQRRDGGYFLHERDEHQGKFPHIGECGGGHDAHAPGNFQEACGCKAGYEFDREEDVYKRQAETCQGKTVDCLQEPGVFR